MKSFLFGILLFFPVTAAFLYGQTIAASDSKIITPPVLRNDTVKIEKTVLGWRTEEKPAPIMLMSKAFEWQKFKGCNDPHELALEFRGSDGRKWKAVKWEKVTE